MDYRKYEELLNRVMKKCPLESGVQTLVFMYLDELFENCTKYEPVITDRLQDSENSRRYHSDGGFSDILVVNKDFDYNVVKDKPDIKLFVELKLPEEIGLEDEKKNIYFIESIDGVLYRTQFLGQLLTWGEGIITNGKKWEHYVITDDVKATIKSKMKEYCNEKIRAKKTEIAETIQAEKCVKDMFNKPVFSCDIATTIRINQLSKKTRIPTQLEVNVNEFLRLTDHINGLIQELNA